MSLTASQRLRLSVFLVITASIAAIFTMVSLGSKLLSTQSSYFAYFEGESLSGLENGATLKFHGITIGFVKTINYDPADLSRIKVEFSVDRDFPMKTDMVAQTVVAGITGLKHVDIMGGTNEATTLPPGSFIETKKSMMADVMSRADDIFADINEIMANIRHLTDTSSDISRIIRNVADITDEVNAFSEGALQKIDQMAEKIDKTLYSVQTIADDIQRTTTDFTERTDLPMLVSRVDSTVVSYRDLADNINITMLQSREDIGSTLMDLQETMENIHELSQMLLENPSIILRGNVVQKRKTR